MKLLKSTLLLVALSILLSFTQSSSVYICDSSSAKKYHLSPTCRGLNACKPQIVKISLGDAQNRGRALCGWED